MGSTIDPRLFVQDFDTVRQAGMLVPAAISAAASQVSNSLTDYAKQQKEEKNRLKAGAAMIDAAAKMFPSQAGMLEGIGTQLKDENVPLSERAAIASQVGELINMTVGEKRWQQEMGQRDRELDIRETGAAWDSQKSQIGVESARTELDMLRQQREIGKTLGPAQLEHAVSMLDTMPGGRGKTVFDDAFLAKARTMPPEAQAKVAEMIVQSLPEEQQMKFVEGMPAMQGGVAMELPGYVDPVTNTFYPTQVAGSQQGVAVDGSAGVLPPKGGESIAPPPQDLQTMEGPVLPADEAKLSGQGVDEKGTPVEFYRYQNRTYTVPVQQMPAEQGGITLGAPVGGATGALTEKQKWDIAQEQKVATEKADDAVAKSEAFVTALDKLEKHDGFKGLFGMGVGTSLVPGTDAASARVIFEQLEGMGFLESVQAMRGMGALSNAEGQKLSIAFMGLSPSMSEKDAKVRIKEIKELVTKGVQRARQIQTTAPAAADPAANAAGRLRSMIPTPNVR
jgi:hypothetical protein